MGRLILLVLAGVVAVFVATWIIHALMFFFLIALVVVVGIGFFRFRPADSFAKITRG